MLIKINFSQIVTKKRNLLKCTLKIRILNHPFLEKRNIEREFVLYIILKYICINFAV